MTSVAASAKNELVPVLDTPSADFNRVTDASSATQVVRVFRSSQTGKSNAKLQKNTVIAWSKDPVFEPLIARAMQKMDLPTSEQVLFLSVTACKAIIDEMRQIEDESLVVVFRKLSMDIRNQLPEELLEDTQITAGAIRDWMRRNKETLRQITSLHLCKAGLYFLPPEIGLLTELRFLYLSGNRLSKLPVHVRLLEKLEYLNLSSNDFTIFPKVIGSLSKLQTLSLADNKLRAIDGGIKHLSLLKGLFLYGNRELRSLPPEIGQLDSLQKLLISYCSFSEFPPEILPLVNLRELDLSHNQMQGPLTGIERLSRLEYLLLIGNPESLLPKLSEETAKLARQSHTKWLALDPYR